MSNLKHFIEQETRRQFEEYATIVGPSSERKQISLRPDAVTLAKIDTMADMLEMSRQALCDELLEQGMEDAIEAYCEAHGPDHYEEARQAFRDKVIQRFQEGTE